MRWGVAILWGLARGGAEQQARPPPPCCRACSVLHPYPAAAPQTNPGETADGLDNDGNGYADGEACQWRAAPWPPGCRPRPLHACMLLVPLPASHPCRAALLLRSPQAANPPLQTCTALTSMAGAARSSPPPTATTTVRAWSGGCRLLGGCVACRSLCSAAHPATPQLHLEPTPLLPLRPLPAGTHVAGTIGAIGQNGGGVAGVCHRVQLVSAKFLGP